MDNVTQFPDRRMAELIMLAERATGNDHGLSPRDRGYMAAISDIVHRGGPMPLALELWCGIGEPSPARLWAARMDEYDIEAALMLTDYRDSADVPPG